MSKMQLEVRALHALTLLAALPMVINIFYAFDSHHDGLSLVTILHTLEAIRNNDPWPFNQYGPTWSILYSLFAFFIPRDFVYLGMRILTLIIYILTYVLLKRSARMLFGKDSKLPTVVGLLFFLAQPFFTNFGSSFVVWPSSVAMLLSAALVFAILKSLDSNSFNFWGLTGLLTALILTTRLQVGILTILFLSILAIFVGRKSLFPLYLGIALPLLAIYGFLIQRNWLRQTLIDQFIFASGYLTGDKSTYPLPLFTLIGTLGFIFLFMASRNNAFQNQLRNLTPILVISLTSLLFVGVQFLVTTRNLALSDALTVFHRRFWVCLIVASLLIYLYESLKRRRLLLGQLQNVKMFSVVALSGINLTQAYPLFDQMHVWWGSVPTLILVAMTCRDFVRNLGIRSKELVAPVLAFTSLLPALIATTIYVNAPHSAVDGYSVKGILVPHSQELLMNDYSDFIVRNFSDGEVITNICENADVFMQSRIRLIPSSGYFVFWAPMKNTKEISDTIVNSSSIKQNRILSCSMNQVPSLSRQNQQTADSIIYEILGISPVNANSHQIFTLINKKWQIWTN